MNLNDQFEHFAVSYTEDLLDRFIVDENKFYLIKKDKSEVLPLNQGFGMGVSGINYFLRILSICFSKKKSDLVGKVDFFLNEPNQISHLESYLGMLENSPAFPASHGFNSGPAGIFLRNKPIQGSNSDASKITSQAADILCDYYSRIDFQQLNHSFYGGTSGLIFCLAHAKRNMKKDHSPSTELILRGADELAKIANAKQFEKYFAMMQVPKIMVGLSWGTSGVIMALSIATRYENKPEYQSAIQVLVEYEDQFVDSATSKRTNLVMNDAGSSLWNPLCYGSTGTVLSRKNESSHISFDPNRMKNDLSEIQALDLNLLATKGSQKLNYCCGVAGMLEAVTESNVDSGPNKVGSSVEFLIENMMELQDDQIQDSFIQGIPGMLYVALKNHFQIKDSIWNISQST